MDAELSRARVAGAGDGAPTRERLMDAAEAHLVRVGYRAVSLQQVAREVGVTKPSLYYHFPGGKQELVVAILHRSLTRVRAGLTRAMATRTGGAGKLRAAARWIVTEPGRGHRMDELHDVLRFIDQRYHEALTEEFYDAAHRPVRAAITEAITSGQFRHGDADFLAWSFLCLARGLIDVDQLPSHPGFAGEAASAEAAERMTDVFLHGVQA